ncbi:hypothetical protein ACWEOZ_11555 [Actinoplanes sp. NPDC004185]
MDHLAESSQRYSVLFAQVLEHPREIGINDDSPSRHESIPQASADKIGFCIPLDRVACANHTGSALIHPA